MMHWLHLLSLATAFSACPLIFGAHTSLNHGNHETFISVSNGSFYQNGKQIYLVSINYWAALNLAASDKAGGNWSRFEAEVRQMADRGINNVRIMASSEGSQSGIQPFRMYPPLMGAPGVYNEDIFVGLDKSIATFGKYKISVVMTLQNFWHWSGGYGQYVSWVDNSTIPYPPSWDPTLNPPYGDYSTNGTWDNFTAYAARFYNDTTIYNATQTLFRRHISTVINRVNTETGITYKDDPTIMTWELTNEPQDPPLEWVSSTAQYIKSLAPKQLVTAGFEGKQGEYWFKLVHSPDAIDYATGHLWVQNWGYYNMTDPSPENLNNALAFGDMFLRNLSDWSQFLGKPVVLEEFGMARNNWENVARGAPAGFYLYDAGANTTNKDTYFQFIISTVVDYFKQGAPWSGAGPWAYGGIWRPFDGRNAYNEEWAGDPPHEAPGWYDLYDDDYAMEIVATQARNVSAFLEKY